MSKSKVFFKGTYEWERPLNTIIVDFEAPGTSYYEPETRWDPAYEDIEVDPSEIEFPRITIYDENGNEVKRELTMVEEDALAEAISDMCERGIYEPSYE